MAFVDDLSFRSVDPVEDIDMAYHYLFKPGIEKCVRDLNDGVWPESRYEFFKKGFEEPDMQMIMHNGADVGCFCIRETENSIVLQRVYIAEEFQRKGIGTYLVDKALEEAHEKKKPLELEVLANNDKAIGCYEKSGFTQTTDVIKNGWNEKFEMYHKDTVKYLPIFGSSPDVSAKAVEVAKAVKKSQKMPVSKKALKKAHQAG